ncbi:MAG: N-acetylmuramoyl-L-alanine amidase [Bacteroidia bacterium]
MAGKKNNFSFFFIFISLSCFGQSFRYLQYIPSVSIKIDDVIKKYQLKAEDKDSLLIFNKLTGSSSLIKGKKYKMPIRIYAFSGDNIRSSIGIDNYNTAREIQNYNTELEKSTLKKIDPKKGHEIWVPLSLLNENKKEFEPYTTTFSLLGKKYEKVEVTDNKMKGELYYLVSGHGGPDPGANCTKDGCMMCEDEYAYDIVLRLARNLISHGAQVYVIVVDKNDGIREEKYLKSDHDEVAYDGKAIPLNQIKRLKQRTDLINKLYKLHDGKYKQKLIEIHIDSRNEDKKIDLFFYHFPGSEAGKKVAETLLETVKEKYNTHQKDRGYTGVVKERNLYSLRETLPLCIYIEVGNITNEFDQKRILFANNRQALANWLAEGLMK